MRNSIYDQVPKYKKSTTAFTLVELIIVIAVIGILAAIVMVGYPAWRTSSVNTAMKNDLLSLSAAMDDRRNFQDAYPTTVPSDYIPSANNVVQLVGVTAAYYCADIYSTVVPSLTLSYDSATKNFRTYPCSGTPSGSPVGGAIPSAPRGTNLAGDFTNWSLAGTATVSNGILTLGTSGNAQSPRIRVSAPASIVTGGDLNAAQQSPNVSLQPNAGYHMSIYYYGADGSTSVANSAGYTSNGCARAFTRGSWQNGVSTCSFSGGPNVQYVHVVYWSSASSFTSPDTQVRNPLLRVSD